MATLEKIRNRAGLLVSVVIGLALLAFILGDLFSQGGTAFQGDRFEIAEIGGESVNYQDFQREVEELVEINQISQQTSSLDQETRERIREQVWEQMTRSMVMQEEYEELGIAISSEELWDMVQGENIHPMIRRMFTNPETGQVNTLAIIQFLKNYEQDRTSKAYWLFLEDQMIRERKFSKFSNLVSQSLFVTPNKAEKLAELNSRQVDFQYVVRRFSSIPDTAIQVSEAELKDYYNKHKEDYKQSASRDIEYIVYDIEPTEEDRQETLEYVQSMKEEFIEATENQEFVNLNSDVSFDDTYYKREAVSDSIDEFMFTASIGEVYGPYLENEYYKISKLTDKKYLPDSVKVRQILIQPNRTQLGVQQAKSLADSLTQVVKDGGNFAQLAQQYSDDQGSAAEGGNLGWISRGQYFEPVLDTALHADRGTVAQIQSQAGFHIIEVTDRGRLAEKVQIATIARKLEPSSETYQNIYSEASRFAGQNNSYQDFKEAANEQGKPVRMANNIQINARQVPGLQEARRLIRAAYDTKKNQIITENNNPVFELGDKFIIGFVTEVRKEGFAEFSKVKDDITINLKEQKKADKIAEEMKADMDGVNSLSEFASKENLRLGSASNITYSSFQIPGAGSEPKVIATSVVIEPNKLSEPIKGENGVYLIQVTNVQENQQSPEMIKMREMQTMQRTATFEAYNALKEAADIKDKRYKFY